IQSDRMMTVFQSLINMLIPYESLNMIQLFHGGARSSSHITGFKPLSASECELPFADFEKPSAMTIEEIQQTIEDYSTATRRAFECGFDGALIHAADGYLVSQFLGTRTNMRHDEYGGSLTNRARFIRQVVRECKKVVPRDFLLGI